MAMKFSIRDIMFVTVIVALALGWWGDHHLKTIECVRLKEEAGRNAARAGHANEAYDAFESMLDKAIPDWKKRVVDSWKESPNPSTPIPPEK